MRLEEADDDGCVLCDQQRPEGLIFQAAISGNGFGGFYARVSGLKTVANSTPFGIQGRKGEWHGVGGNHVLQCSYRRWA